MSIHKQRIVFVLIVVLACAAACLRPSVRDVTTPSDTGAAPVAAPVFALPVVERLRSLFDWLPGWAPAGTDAECECAARCPILPRTNHWLKNRMGCPEVH